MVNEKKEDSDSCRAKAQYKKTKAGTTKSGPDGVFTIGYGSGGIEEMYKFLPEDDSMVLWGLVDFQIGSGKFARQKNVCMHLNGEHCKNVLKGRTNSNRKKVVGVIGSVNGTFQICHQSECHVDSVLEKIIKYFSVDHGEGDAPKRITIEDLKEEYEKQIKIDQAKDLADHVRKTAKDFDRKFTNDEILNYIHKNGPFNWALFRPKMKQIKSEALAKAELSDLADFVNAGSMSINEMMKDVKNKDVLGGIVRMGFGHGTFKRTKQIGFWWSGEKVGPVARGTLNAKQKRILQLLMPWSFSLSTQKKDDLTVTNLVDIVHKKLVVDGDTKTGEDYFSEEAYYDALGEEIKKTAKFFGDEASGRKTYSLSPADAVKKLKNTKCGINWVLLGLKV